MPQKETLDRAAYTCMLVSYRRLPPQFQFSLSGVTLVYCISMALMSIMIADDKKIYKCGLLFCILSVVLQHVLIVLLCIQFADSAGNIAAGTQTNNPFSVLQFQYFSFKVIL